MLDGRFDQHFAELFAASLSDPDAKAKPVPTRPLLLAALTGLALFIGLAVFR